MRRRQVREDPFSKAWEQQKHEYFSFDFDAAICVEGALILSGMPEGRLVGWWRKLPDKRHDGQYVIHAIKLLRVHGGCLGVERR